MVISDEPVWGEGVKDSVQEYENAVVYGDMDQESVIHEGEIPILANGWVRNSNGPTLITEHGTPHRYLNPAFQRHPVSSHSVTDSIETLLSLESVRKAWDARDRPSPFSASKRALLTGWRSLPATSSIDDELFIPDAQQSDIFCRRIVCSRYLKLQIRILPAEGVHKSDENRDDSKHSHNTNQIGLCFRFFPLPHYTSTHTS